MDSGPTGWHCSIQCVITETGDVPLLEIEPVSFDGTIEFTEQQKGTTEYAECNGRGVCGTGLRVAKAIAFTHTENDVLADYKTGICKCSQNFGSSDGLGNAGRLGDCGTLMLHKDCIYLNCLARSYQRVVRLFKALGSQWNEVRLKYCSSEECAELKA